MPSIDISWSSQTAISSAVRLVVVEDRHSPRMVSPSNRAKTILVFPESIASSMVRARIVEKDVPREDAADVVIFVGHFQGAVGTEPGEASFQNRFIGEAGCDLLAQPDRDLQPGAADRREALRAPDLVPIAQPLAKSCQHIHRVGATAGLVQAGGGIDRKSVV